MVQYQPSVPIFDYLLVIIKGPNMIIVTANPNAHQRCHESLDYVTAIHAFAIYQTSQSNRYRHPLQATNPTAA